MHRHDHDHDELRSTSRRVLTQVLLLNFGYFVVELVGGLASGSLALVADAGHMLSDAASLALALLAVWFAARPPTPRKSFGFYRAEILAALVNGMALVAIAGYILFEAARRIGGSGQVDGLTVTVIAVVGLGVNTYSFVRLREGGSGLNMRAASMHMLADMLGSIGAITAGILVWTLQWTGADAIIGAALAVLIAAGSWGLIREAVDVLLEATPAHIDLHEVADRIAAQPGVLDVHDVHVWTLTSGYLALSAHVVARDADRAQSLLVPTRELVYHDFGIQHATLQIETPGLQDEPVHCVDDPRCLP